MLNQLHMLSNSWFDCQQILFVTATTCPVLFAVYMQVSFARRITPAQYKDESVQYTQQAVRALRESPEYKQHVQRCKR